MPSWHCLASLATSALVGLNVCLSKRAGHFTKAPNLSSTPYFWSAERTMLRQALPLGRQSVGRSIGSVANTQWRTSRQIPNILKVRDMLRRELQQTLTKLCRDSMQTPKHQILILNPASMIPTPLFSQEPPVLPRKALNHRLLALSCLPHQQPFPYDHHQTTLYHHRALHSFLPRLREARSRLHHLHQFLQPREYVPAPQRLLRMALLRTKAVRLPQRRHSPPPNASLDGSEGRCRH